MTEQSRPAETTRDDINRVVEEKFMISWFTPIERHGVANVHRTAELLYSSLYDPDAMENEIQSTAEFPDRADFFEAPLPEPPAGVPEREEFTEAIKDILRRGIDYRECLYPEALPALERLTERGRVTVWSKGDTHGIPEADLPGSLQQFHKIAATGLGKWRAALAQKRGARRQDLLRLSVDEDKRAELPQLVRETIERGVRQIVVVDDVSENLAAARAEALRAGLRAIVIRVNKRFEPEPNQPGRYDGQRNHYEVQNVGDVPELVKRLTDPGSKVDTLMDFDGVMSRDSVRLKLTKQAVIQGLRDRGWIA